jgi:UDPglucose 6-dehydrogenase
MKVAVFGTGYVGLTTGACLADIGNSVTCIDIDNVKIERLKSGKTPFYEPGLGELVRKNIEAGRIFFTTDNITPVKESEILIIAVGTPSRDSGQVDLTQIRDVSAVIGCALDGYRLIVNKSTVPPGTGDLIRDMISAHYKGEFDLVYDLEFLREGTAVSDFMHPDRIVIGYTDARALSKVKELYEARKSHFVFTDIYTAEVIKYACNAYLATSISFINTIADVCDRFGADVIQVSDAMRMDKRIGPLAFLDAGIGYGGSCLPKDIQCLIKTCEQNGIGHELLSAVEKVNRNRQDLMLRKLVDTVGDLKGMKIAVWGLSFKPESDDMRDAPSIAIVKGLQDAGAVVRAYDPVANDNAKKIFTDVKFHETPFDAAEGSDAVVIITGWDEFKELDKDLLKKKMTGKTIIDGRNILDAEEMRFCGFQYIGIGR